MVDLGQLPAKLAPTNQLYDRGVGFACGHNRGAQLSPSAGCAQCDDVLGTRRRSSQVRRPSKQQPPGAEPRRAPGSWSSLSQCSSKACVAARAASTSLAAARGSLGYVPGASSTEDMRSTRTSEHEVRSGGPHRFWPDAASKSSVTSALVGVAQTHVESGAGPAKPENVGETDCWLESHMELGLWRTSGGGSAGTPKIRLRHIKTVARFLVQTWALPPDSLASPLRTSGAISPPRPPSLRGVA